MPIHYPPNDRIPPTAKRAKTSPTSRIVAYREPPTSFWHDFWRRLFSAPVIIPVVFLGTIIFGVLFYYWNVFSHRIDKLLQGEVYTRSAGIYAAPRQLRVGETLSQEELIAYLKRAGYVAKGQGET